MDELTRKVEEEFKKACAMTGVTFNKFGGTEQLLIKVCREVFENERTSIQDPNQ